MSDDKFVVNNLPKTLLPFYSAINKLSYEVEAFKDRSDCNFSHPREACEFTYALAQGLKNKTLPFLEDWQKKVLRKAIDVKEVSTDGQDCESSKVVWADGFVSLGATDDDVQTHRWQSAKGIVRICTVRISKYLMTENISGDALQDEDFPELLPFMNNALKKTKGSFNFDIDVSDINVFEPTNSILNFPQGIKLSVKSYCSFVPENADLLAEFKKIADQKQEGHKLFFWVLIDSVDSRALFDLTFAYRKLSGVNCNTHPKLLQANGLLERAAIGLEGVLIVRELQNPVSKHLQPNKEDKLWGGGGWFAWLLTIFQRQACSELAKETAKLGDELLGKPSTFPKAKIKEYRDRIIDLETQWMYREISTSTDIDYLYREFQVVFDIEKMWGNIREQTELITHHAEVEQTKSIQSIQTIGGMIVGAIVILFSFFGSNFFEKEDIVPVRYFVFYNDSFTPHFVFFITVIMVTAKGVVWFLKKSIGLRLRDYLHMAVSDFFSRSNPLSWKLWLLLFTDFALTMVLLFLFCVLLLFGYIYKVHLF